MGNIFEEIKNKKLKVSVSITIDSDLKDKLEELKKQEGIETLSPLLNQLIWDWFNRRDKK